MLMITELILMITKVPYKSTLIDVEIETLSIPLI